MTELLPALFLALGYLLLFGCTEALHRLVRVPVEWSRKFMHVAGGLLSLLLPVLFSTPYMVLVLAAAFGGLLWGTRRVGLLDSVHAVSRTSQGSVLFPIPLFICFLLMYWRGNPALFYVPVLILTIADPLAFAVGTRWPWRPYRIGSSTKTGSGSGAFAFAAFVLSMAYLSGVHPLPLALGYSLMLCMVTTFAEAFSDYGFDNLTVPLAAAGVLMIA